MPDATPEEITMPSLPIYPTRAPELVEPTHELTRRARSIQNLAAVVASRLPAAIERLGADDNDDGYPGGGGRSGGGRSTAGDPVGSVALRRSSAGHLSTLGGDLDDQLILALRGLQLANKVLDRIIGRQTMSPAEFRDLMCFRCGLVADPNRDDRQCTTCGREDDDRRHREANERRMRRHRGEK